MAAAAVAARKKRDKAAKLAAKRREDEAQLDQWFRTYDSDKSGMMDRGDVRSLLSSVKRELTKDPSAEVADELLDRIMTKYDKSGDGQLERTELLPAVKKYKSILQQTIQEKKRLKELFERHDADKTKQLTQAELFTLLQEVSASHAVPKPSVETDVAFVIEECDADQSGAIEIEELEPAVATWLKYCKDMPPEPAPASSACSLL